MRNNGIIGTWYVIIKLYGSIYILFIGTNKCNVDPYELVSFIVLINGKCRGSQRGYIEVGPNILAIAMENIYISV